MIFGIYFNTFNQYMFYVSTIYNISIATTNTELIYNAVIILFIMEIDERAFEAIDAVNQRWVDKVTKREEMDDGTMPGHGNGEKSDGALTSEEVEALLEQHTSQLKQQRRQLEERVQLLEEKNDAR